MVEIKLSVLHIKEVQTLLNLIAKYKDELPQELVDQLLLLNTLEG